MASQNLEITEEQFLNWLADPVTRAHKEFLRRWKEQLKDQWANGDFIGENNDESARLGANAFGKCFILDLLIELNFEHFSESLRDE